MSVPIATTRSATGIPTGKLAVWWVLASEIVIFGGLIVCYLLYRIFHLEAWAVEAKNTQLLAGAVNTCVLLTSSLFVVMAHQSAEKKNLKATVKYLWLTIGGGGIFMCIKAIEYTLKFQHHLTIFKSVFWGFYFMATGLHGFHVLIGMIIMAIISRDVAKGKNLHRVENIGIYWHFVDIVWIFLFPLLYIAK